MAGCYFLTRWIFLRGLAMIYIIAFASVLPQLNGLIGSTGILPADLFLTHVSSLPTITPWLDLPTIFWWVRSDTALITTAIAGIVCGGLLFIGLAERIAAILAFIFYLSLVNVGQVFFSFQWDSLLLETGFLAIFLTSGHLLPRIITTRPPNKTVILLLHFLLFRLMFSSGLVKLLSGDQTWIHFTALEYHYLTQPLPTPLAWYADQLPAMVQKISTASVLIIELLVPFFIFLGTAYRLKAGALIATLQVLIMLTGNYTFFNLLCLLLCIPLLDDARLKYIFPSSFRVAVLQKTTLTPAPFSLPSLVLLFSLGAFAIVQLYVTAFGSRALPQVIASAAQAVQSYRIVNRYGLFAVMTTERNEIIIEGSLDGASWSPYELPYKPGALHRPPRINFPFQPRLDWQLWFAALSPPRSNDWLFNLIAGLFENRPAIVGLFETVPFGNEAPRFIRLSFYRYEFTSTEERAQSGDYWKRHFLGHYLSAIENPSMQKS